MSDKYFDDDILDERISTHQKERNERRAKLIEKKQREEAKAKVAAENKKSRRKVFLIAAAVLIVLVALFGRNAYQIIQLTKEKQIQEQKLLELENSINRLNEELERVTSDEYIEQQAREQLNMIYPGETLYVVTE
ncbi:MAG: septum formation initiator family protein [Bacillota bacterium]|nr:septum formation initiator family protein [Bacillota bacterium]